MKVRIKVSGQLHRTLRKMIVNDETRFSRLRGSPWSAWNLQKLLVYGLIRRKAYKRKGNPNKIERRYDADERRALGKTLPMDKLDRALGFEPVITNAYPYIRPKPNPLCRGIAKVEYLPTAQGRRVYTELDAATDYYYTTTVASNPFWKRYFIKHVW